MNRVFVSYSRRNRTFTERLARDLSDAGMEVWVDWRQIHAGEFWQEEIFRGIERSEILVVVLSPDAVRSEWVQREVNTARSHNKTIIPVMAVEAYDDVQRTESLRWILNIHFIQFENRYEEAFTDLLDALPGKRHLSAFDVVDPAKIPNPFKGLEAFQQTDAHFFFGQERLVVKALRRLQVDRPIRFLGIVGASGSGKSSLVRAGVIPALRRGEIAGSESWRVMIFTPGASPVEALSQRLAPLIQDKDAAAINDMLHEDANHLHSIIDDALLGTPPTARLMLVVDQFEEVFTRAGETERALFLKLVNDAVTTPGGRASVLVTMRADFFDHIGHYPDLAALFEQENMVIVTEMTAPELLRTIEGPAHAVGLTYDHGLAQRILDDVRRQPGSLPLLQYALKALFEHREGARLTTRAYEEIGGVRRALAQHAEEIYSSLDPSQQAIMRRVLLRLIEVDQDGEATRRRISRNDLNFRDVPQEAVQDVLDLMTSAQSRLLIASREIKSSDDQSAPTTWIDVGHEALIREWERFRGWVAENVESLRYGSELLQSARDWEQAGRDSAYLLVGNRLVRAQVWLESADATSLQREFIAASEVEEDRRREARRKQVERELELQRKAATRLRLFVAVLVVGLIVAIVLSAISLDSLNRANISQTQAAIALEDANNARSTAVANQQVAVSLALAASANRSLADNDDELAVMLAVAANEQPVPPPQSQRVLSEVAYARGTRFVLDAQGGAVNTVATEGKWLVSAAGNLVYLWNLQTGELAQTFTGHEDIVRSAALDVERGLVLSGGDDDTVIVWEMSTGKALNLLKGHNTDVLSVDMFDAGDQGVYAVSSDEEGEVILWDLNQNRELLRYNGHDSAVNQVAFSADGRYVLTGSNDGTVRRWSASTGTLESVIVAGEDEAIKFLSVAFDPTNPDRIIAGTDRSDVDLVYLWDLGVSNSQPLRTFEGHAAQINSVAFSPDGQFIVSGGFDDNVIVWDATTGQEVNVYDEHDGVIYGITFSSDGQRIASASFDGTVRISDVNRAEEIHRYVRHSSSQTTFAVYGPDDRTILSAADQEIRLWNVDNQLTIQQFTGHTDRVTKIALSSDGQMALSASRDHTLILWDVATGQAIRTLTGHANTVESVTFLPGDAQAISGGGDGEIIVWDIATGDMVQRFAPATGKDAPGHTGAVIDIAVNPDGTRAVSGSDDQSLIMWNLETGEMMIVMQGQNARVSSVDFDYTAKRLVSGGLNGSVILWDVDEESPTFGQEIRSFEGHDGAVFDVAFAPDGQTIASVSLDRTIRLWQISSGFELRRYSTSPIIARSVDFSQDARKILTGMSNGTVREWRLLTQLNDLLAWTFANRFVADPTCEERILFNISPLCADDTEAPTRTPFLLPTPTPTLVTAHLMVDGQAIVNTDSGDSLNIRSGRDALATNIIVAQVDDGAVVTLLEGPVDENGFVWWRVRTESGAEGWAVRSVPAEGLQTLIPQ